MQTANPRVLKIVLTLGPFLNRDEAEDIECQAHGLLSQYRVRGEWFSINPLIVPEFWEWIDAQILPVRICEKGAFYRAGDRTRNLSECAIARWQRGRGGFYSGERPIQRCLDLS